MDMRKLPAAAQEERRQVIGLRQRGMTYDAIATQVGLNPHWRVQHLPALPAARPGRAGLKSGRNGPAPGQSQLLSVEQEREVRKLIRHHTPDALEQPFALWSRAAVQALVLDRFGVWLAVRTTGTYLKRWGYTAQKPLWQSYEHDPPAAVRRWLRPGLSGHYGAGQGSRWHHLWGDETGLRSDDIRGRGYAPRGRTPTVRVNHKRAGLGLISVVSNKGELRWMMLDGCQCRLKSPQKCRLKIPHFVA
ncbi:MAG: winged helix-turn-helix domain-containing protein [Proteobacteria bacterium]|nr:winged helix-turn-helix domain-containing protein [Pseudomonadota bacterium]